MRYKENEYETSSGSWLLTFILGGLIGAAVAFLVAPKSGRQTRERLKDAAQDAKEMAGDYYDQARSKVTDAVQKGAEVLHHKKSETTAATSEAKNSFQQTDGTNGE